MILAGLGIQADIVQVMAVQVLIQFMIYFAPSPGGSGFAEVGIAVLFYRMLFFPAVVGAFVVIGRLKKDV